MNESGVLVSSCDFTHGATGFASLQGEVDALKAENAALQGEVDALRAAQDALEARLMAAINTISLTPGPAGADGTAGKDGAQGTTGSRGPTGPAGAIPNMNQYVSQTELTALKKCITSRNYRSGDRRCAGG